MKKQTLAQDAFRLYAEKFMSLEDIARQVHLNERTLRRWKNLMIGKQKELNIFGLKRPCIRIYMILPAV